MEDWALSLDALQQAIGYSFREPKMWEQGPLKFKVFGKLAAKGILMDKIEKSGAFEAGLRAAVFCAKEVDAMSGSDIAARLKRMVSSRFPISSALESDRVLSIEPADRSMAMCALLWVCR